MDSVSIVAGISILTAGLAIAIGSIGPALGEGRALAQALSSIAHSKANSMLIGCVIGLVFAGLYFGALYYWVQCNCLGKPFVLGSYIVRFSLLGIGMTLVMQAGFETFVGCTLGFFVVRQLLLIRYIRDAQLG